MGKHDKHLPKDVRDRLKRIEDHPDDNPADKKEISRLQGVVRKMAAKNAKETKGKHRKP